METSEIFYATIRKTVAGTYEITIPIKHIKIEGWEEGNELKVRANKVVPKEVL